MSNGRCLIHGIDTDSAGGCYKCRNNERFTPQLEPDFAVPSVVGLLAAIEQLKAEVAELRVEVAKLNKEQSK